MNTPEYIPVNFLIVDDDDVSIQAIKRAIKKNGVANPVHTAKDGIEALEFLDKNISEPISPPPFIITLDLSMPRMNGIEFLEAIRNHPVYSKLVVFVLTTSNSPEDIDSAYEKNIAGYIVKDNATESFEQALRLLTNYSKLIVLPEIK